MKIIAVSGASGGHIYPAVSFLEKLKDRQGRIEAFLVLPRESIKVRSLPEGVKIKFISISRLGAGINFNSIKSLLNFIKGSFESLFILFEFKPDIVVGFGSLNSIPLVMLAWVLRIKTLIHEQNVLPGRANRLLAKFADRAAISFLRTRDFLGSAASRCVLTGNPIRSQLEDIDKNAALERLGLSRGKFTVLACGGSSGSHRINLSFLEALSALKKDSDFQAVHICGKKDYDYLRDMYLRLGQNVKLFSFLDDMQFAYSAADLALCRAGASTIAELIRYRKPALLVPYPFAYEHQAANARLLEEAGSACLIKDQDLTAAALEKFLRELANNPEKLKAMVSGYDNFPRASAADLLAGVALDLDK